MFDIFELPVYRDIVSLTSFVISSLEVEPVYCIGIHSVGGHTLGEFCFACHGMLLLTRFVLNWQINLEF